MMPAYSSQGLPIKIRLVLRTIPGLVVLVAITGHRIEGGAQVMQITLKRNFSEPKVLADSMMRLDRSKLFSNYNFSNGFVVECDYEVLRMSTLLV